MEDRKTRQLWEDQNKTHWKVYSPALEIDDDDEHESGRQQVRDVGQVLSVESFLEGAHLENDKYNGVVGRGQENVKRSGGHQVRNISRRVNSTIASFTLSNRG